MIPFLLILLRVSPPTKKKSIEFTVCFSWDLSLTFSPSPISFSLHNSFIFIRLNKHKLISQKSKNLFLLIFLFISVSGFTFFLCFGDTCPGFQRKFRFFFVFKSFKFFTNILDLTWALTLPLRMVGERERREKQRKKTSSCLECLIYLSVLLFSLRCDVFHVVFLSLSPSLFIFFFFSVFSKVPGFSTL